jgi:hypothetical protein
LTDIGRATNDQRKEKGAAMPIEDEDFKVIEAFFAYVTQDPQLTSDLERHWRHALADGRIEAAWV